MFRAKVAHQSLNIDVAPIPSIDVVLGDPAIKDRSFHQGLGDSVAG